MQKPSSGSCERWRNYSRKARFPLHVWKSTGIHCQFIMWAAVKIRFAISCSYYTKDIRNNLELTEFVHHTYIIIFVESYQHIYGSSYAEGQKIFPQTSNCVHTIFVAYWYIQLSRTHIRKNYLFRWIVIIFFVFSAFLADFTGKQIKTRNVP